MKNIFVNCIEWFKKIFRRKERRISDISLELDYDDDEYNDEYNYNLL